MPESSVILLSGGLLALFFLALGVPIRYFKCYGLISGYNSASAEEKKRYDIEGLAQHLGNGLITMSWLIFATAWALSRNQMGWAIGLMVVFLLVVLVMVIGGQKFLPYTLDETGQRRHLPHVFLEWLLPQKAYLAIKRGTQNWLVECPCGHRRDYWEAGGVRYKAIGERREWNPCPVCQKATWHKVRRKLPGEVVALQSEKGSFS